MEVTKVRERIGFLNIAKNAVESVLGRVKHGSLTFRHSNGQEARFGEDCANSVVLEVLDERFYTHCLFYGDIGFGEAYTEGWWTTPDLTKLFTLLIENMHEIGGLSGTDKAAGNLLKWVNRGVHLLRANTESGSRKNISDHYDLSNDFYKLWLDETMTYSSALWNAPDLSLAEAQREKWKSLANALELKSSDSLLEIGTGWGGFALFAVKEFGCSVTTVTISQQQYNYAKELFEKEGVTDKINLQLLDYRKITGQFDKIVSIEMMEAIGHEYLPTFFKVLSDRLKPNGIISFQVITMADARYDEYRRSIDWIQKHIFPGALLPSVGHMMKVINETGELQLLKFLDMGPHYAKTLRVWDKNFSRVSDQVAKLGFDERFQRKWHYYLQYCEAAFETRNISVVQMTLTRPNNTTISQKVF